MVKEINDKVSQETKKKLSKGSKRKPGFNKGDKASGGQFKKAEPVKHSAPTASAKIPMASGEEDNTVSLTPEQYKAINTHRMDRQTRQYAQQLIVDYLEAQGGYLISPNSLEKLVGDFANSNPRIPTDTLLGAIDDLEKEGTIECHIGIISMKGNWNGDDVKDVERYIEAFGLEYSAKNGGFEVRIAIAKREGLLPNIFDILIKDKNIYVLYVLARNDNLPEEMFKVLLNKTKEGKVYHSHIETAFYWPAAPGENNDPIITPPGPRSLDEESILRSLIAPSHKNVDLSLLEESSENSNHHIRKEVIAHPAVTLDTLRRMAKNDVKWRIRKLAAKQLRVRANA